jgi:chloramphenicol O-acetyltransferase
MRIIKYDNPTTFYNMAKKLNKYFDVIETEVSMSFRIFENKNTKELHIYHKIIY